MLFFSFLVAFFVNFLLFKFLFLFTLMLNQNQIQYLKIQTMKNLRIQLYSFQNLCQNVEPSPQLVFLQPLSESILKMMMKKMTIENLSQMRAFLCFVLVIFILTFLLVYIEDFFVDLFCLFTVVLVFDFVVFFAIIIF